MLTRGFGMKSGIHKSDAEGGTTEKKFMIILLKIQKKKNQESQKAVDEAGNLKTKQNKPFQNVS